ncbi:hypothetical protein [Paractinoplanes brasiliensis]|uniref:AAA domain-containing protein n=1 Tax=Paractinoplanes brasiliensis TaxID=52695 RepID=A0A4R6JCT8_9ACTN|nr:hypothetical protein [Actinoplanes brasiliensis]TDO33167.1 hypothetical protein C8E87_8654 [Actinoplanes brasiliensis]GID33481.1 hypothetical protein Abr02nite_84640 [Actinoplanes brasiliensis]
MFLTIAGSSCSGKTTAVRACAQIDGLVVHDFDEIGVPSGADVVWRQRSLQEWIRRALRLQADGLDMLLTGQSPLGEVLACPSAVELDAIAACLLDVDDQVRRQRLERRDPGKWDAEATRKFIGWARWHRGHAADPRHLPEAITAAGDERMRWDRWSGWTAGDPRWNVRVIDTTGRSVDQSAAGIRQWVNDARADFAAGRLALHHGAWAAHRR